MGDLGGSPVPGADRAAPVQGEDRKAEGLTANVILDPVILRFAVLTYLVVLPVGHLLVIPVNGTTARGSDVFLALVLLAGSLPGGSRNYRCFRGVAPSIWQRSFLCPSAFGWHSARLEVPTRATL
mgnify:CR=1 FL=1